MGVARMPGRLAELVAPVVETRAGGTRNFASADGRSGMMSTSAPETRDAAKIAPHRPLTEYYREASERRKFLNELFDDSAADYNWMSGALSFWTDRKYRAIALRRAGLRPGMKTLDVATGTGLVTLAALDLGLSKRDVIGIDPSRGMLDQNREATGIHLIQGCGERLPFADRSFDFAAMGYALRHVEDLGQLFLEFRRVIRPGGRVLILEISRPPSRLGFGLMTLYMRRVLPLVMRLRHRGTQPLKLMDYYWATISECVAPEVIFNAMTASGLQCSRHTLSGGMLNEYLGVAE